MVDVFSEVDEQVRSDQIRALFQRYLPGALGGLLAVLVLALAYWGYSAHRQSTAEKASEIYAHGMDHLSQGDSAGAFPKFAEVAKSSSANLRRRGWSMCSASPARAIWRRSTPCMIHRSR